MVFGLKYVVAAMSIAMLSPTAAAAQAREQLLARYRAECLQQFQNLRGPGQAENVREHVRSCIIAKMQAAAPTAGPTPANPTDTAVATAGGQTREQLIERFRVECFPQFQAQRRKGDDVLPLMRDCISTKLSAAVQDIALHPRAGPELQLQEGTPWLVTNRGPAEAKGVIYFIRGGWSEESPVLDRYQLPPYYLKSLNEAGWDIIDARIPQTLPNPGLGAGPYLAGRAEPFVRARAKVLKADGYHKIVLAGHAWGGWEMMLAAKDNPDVDALILSSPSLFGTKTTRFGPSAVFNLNLTQFGPTLAGVKTPTVVLLFPDDEYEPGGRGEIAEDYFAEIGVPHIVIDDAPGFSGHFAGWLPFFDFVFGQCITQFLDNPVSSVACPLRPRAKNDFRALLLMGDLAGGLGKGITTAVSIVGKAFDAYALNAESRRYDFVSPTERINLQPFKEFHEAFSFRGGLLCVAAACTKLIQWSDREILEYDPNAGELKAWWIRVR
jgi:pimeloyl-ACP methyl ester carboxylesterase